MNPKIETAFTFHKIEDKQAVRCNLIRLEAKDLARRIDECVPDSREKSLALTKLEECVMWANAGIARNQTQLTPPKGSDAEDG